MRRERSIPVFGVVAATMALVVACGDDGGGSRDEACFDALEQQARQRFAVGDTFWLSAPVEGCEPDWELADAPAGNANAVVVGDDGFVRFTPHVVGDHAFAAGGQVVEEITVVASPDVPFHHVNYYGGDSIAFVGDEVWTANVYSPTLTRLDPDDLSVLGEIAVGPWPVALAWHQGSNTVWVAQKGGDTVGVIDVEAGHVVDAIWVGDEPSNIVVGQASGRVFVPLATDGQVAVVDVETRAVVDRFDVERDPYGIALSADETLLAVATRRSGQAERAPYEDTDPADQRDIVVLDAATGQRVTTLIDVGTTINGVRFADDGTELLVANTRNNTQADFVEGEGVFTHELVRYDVSSGDRVDGADLGLQESAAGLAVFVYAPAVDGNFLWVPAEGSDRVLLVDSETLVELDRFDAPGRPRAAIARDGVAWVHGEQGFVVTRVDSGGALLTATTGTDPRPPEVAEGQAFFTGAGESYGANWGCHGCHVDGLTDTLVWRVGPFPEFEVPRPIFWTEGTEPLGWTAYVNSPEAFALAGPVNIGVRTVTEEAEALGSYVASLMPPPPETSLTTRDGAMSEQALRGRDLFYGKAACVGCHSGPTGTNQAVFEQGITAGRTDVPSLVAIGRFGIWLKDGSAPTLEDAVRDALQFLGNDALNDDEVADLTRYLEEWTAREFFLLDADPEQNESAAAPDAPIVLTFSFPVWDAAANLDRIELLDENDAPVPFDVEADARHVLLTSDALEADATYTVRVAAEFESFAERSLGEALAFDFTTAAEPALRLEGDYVLTYQVPGIDIENARLDTANPVATALDVVASPTPSGAILDVDLLLGLEQTVRAVVDGDAVRVESIAIPAGPFSLGDSSGLEGTVFDDDGDGVADRIEGGTTLFSGPGFWEQISWTFGRPPEVGECDLGETGPVAVSVDREQGGAPVISWDGDGGALGLYVTDPGAKLPTLPGTFVEDGAAYWVLEANNFPTGFSGPVTYGTAPEFADEVTEDHGGEPGAAALEEGRCYQFSVTGSDFRTGNVVLRW